jgi:hypothetical protein
MNTMRTLSLLLLLMACTPSESDAPADSGAADVFAASDVVDVVDAPETTAQPDAAPLCCPMETPSCECFQTGARDALTGRCVRICDAAPTGVTRVMGDDGCPFWRTSAVSCLSPVDGGR